jgi:hypothetical protein
MQDTVGPSPLKVVLYSILALLLVVAIVVGGWLGGWWLKGANTDRQTNIDRRNNGTQLTYINKVSSNMEEIARIDTQMNSPATALEEKSSLLGQKIAIVSSTCRIAHLITELPSDQTQWVALNC